MFGHARGLKCFHTFRETKYWKDGLGSTLVSQKPNSPGYRRELLSFMSHDRRQCLILPRARGTPCVVNIKSG